MLDLAATVGGKGVGRAEDGHMEVFSGLILHIIYFKKCDARQGVENGKLLFQQDGASIHKSITTNGEKIHF